MQHAMETCTGCGASLYAGDEWCLQCLTPAGAPAVAVAAPAAVAAAPSPVPPAAPAVALAPPPPAAPAASSALPDWMVDMLEAVAEPPVAETRVAEAPPPPTPAPAGTDEGYTRRTAEPPPFWTPPAEPSSPPPWAATPAAPAAPPSPAPAASPAPAPWEAPPASVPPWRQATVAREEAGVFGAPGGVATTGDFVPPVSPGQADAKVAGTTTVILLLGFLLQLGFALAGRTGTMEVVDAIRWSNYAILAFYGVVMWLVARRAGGLDFQPVWTRGPSTEGAVFGGVIGVAAATVVLMLVKAAFGEFRVADSLRLLVGDATLGSLALAVLITMVAAPVVEELLFRGLVAEALRYRGTKAAIGVSAFLFAVWHMQLSIDALIYYTIAGVLLGLVYWKWGLASSMACHLAFNGTLLLMTVIFIVGPGESVSADGVSFKAPGGWTELSAEEMVQLRSQFPSALIAANGPSGAVVLVEREHVPGTGGVPVEMMVQNLNAAGAIELPGFRFRPNTARVVEYPAGRGVYFELEAQGREAWLTMFPKGDALWVFTLTTAGSNRAKGDFEDILESVRLP